MHLTLPSLPTKSLARISSLSTILLIVWFCTSFSLVSAQTMPIDLSVSPPATYLQVAPGKSATHTVVLEQHGSLPLKMTLSVVDFESDGQTGQPVLQFNEGTSFRYLKIKNPDVKIGQPFDLNPGQKKQLSFEVAPPSDAPQGEFPMTLLFTALPNTELTLATGTQVSGMVGSNLIVLLSTSDADKGKLVLEKIQVPRLVDSFGSLTFSLLAKNEGRNATTASGSATVTNWQNQAVAEYTLYPDMILAQTSRLLRHGSSLESDSADEITADFSYKPLFLLGPYTISATLQESGLDNSNYSTVSVRVFAFPFSLVVLLLIGLTLYGATKYFTNKYSSSA